MPKNINFLLKLISFVLQTNKNINITSNVKKLFCLLQCGRRVFLQSHSFDLVDIWLVLTSSVLQVAALTKLKKINFKNETRVKFRFAGRAFND